MRIIPPKGSLQKSRGSGKARDPSVPLQTEGSWQLSLGTNSTCGVGREGVHCSLLSPEFLQLFLTEHW